MATSSGRNRPVAAVSCSSRARWARPTGRSEQLTRRLGPLRVAQPHLGDAPYQLGVVPSGGLGHARQAGVVVQAGAGVDVEDPDAALVVEPQVHATAPLPLHYPPRGLRPLLAASAAGSTRAETANSAAILPGPTGERGFAGPAGASSALTMGLRGHAAMVHRLAPVSGTPVNSSVPTTCSAHSLLPCTPSHRLNTRSARRATWNQRMSCRTGTLRTS